MANLLDETYDKVNENGRDVHVIDEQIPVEIGFGSTLFEVALWIGIPIIILICDGLLNPRIDDSIGYVVGGCILGMIPGLIFTFKKIFTHNYFQQLEQQIQAEASNIDNYLEQRVQILQNVVGLVERSIELDKDVMKTVAAYRGGANVNEQNRSEVNAQIGTTLGHLFPQIEAYPELKAHSIITDAMQQNNYLQREITAARTVYNSRVTQWNTDIFSWPTKMIVAARHGYTTRIPFTASAETLGIARGKFF